MDGTAAHVLRRLRRFIRPSVRISDPPAGVRFERDVEVTARDGCVLRVNVFRPETPGRYPVLLCAHPYGKDHLPRPGRRGGYKVPTQCGPSPSRSRSESRRGRAGNRPTRRCGCPAATSSSTPT